MTSSLLDRLGGGSGLFTKSDQDPQPVAETPAPAIPKGRKPNAYAGACAKCGERVEAGAGLLGAKVEGRWTVEHFDCELAPTPDPRAAVEAPAQKSDRPVIRVGATVPDGKYTIVFEDGSYRTLKVSTQSEDANFKPGAQIVGYLSGSDNEWDYTSFADINERGYANVWRKHLGNEALVEALRVLVADPRAASAAYGQRSQTCGRCGRTLTTPESLAAGIGPECSRKLGW